MKIAKSQVYDVEITTAVLWGQNPTVWDTWVKFSDGNSMSVEMHYTLHDAILAHGEWVQRIKQAKDEIKKIPNVVDFLVEVSYNLTNNSRKG